MPILTAGLAMSRAMELDSFHLLLKRARAHSFPLSKRARLFPSAAYRRSAPAQLAVGILTPCRLGCFDVAGRFCGVDKWADVLFPQSTVGIRSLCRLGCFVVARLLCRTKMKTFVSHTVGDERACPLWGNGLLLLGRFWKVSGQRVWGREP